MDPVYAMVYSDWGEDSVAWKRLEHHHWLLQYHHHLIVNWLISDQELEMGKGKGELDDKEKMWKNSLRPLDPGILSDQIKKKKER